MTNGNIISLDGRIPLPALTRTVTNHISGGDPIGDALRSALIAYWTLNEVSGVRFDSSSNGIDLTENGDPVPSDTGLFGLAVSIPDSEEFFYQLYSVTQSINLPDHAIGFSFLFHSNMEDSGVADSELMDAGNIFTANLSGTNVLSIVTTDPDSPKTAVYASGWNHVILEISVLDYMVTLNNVQVITGTLNSIVSTFTQFHIGGNTGNGNSLVYKPDEVFCIPRLFTSDEKDYLYNSGNGRTLYP